MKDNESKGGVEAVHAALRALGGQMAWHTHAAALAAGIHPTDLEIMELLSQHGELTAGRLAELSGLTTGAITGVIDRLAASNHIERARDESDRRKVVVRKTITNDERMWEVYRPLTEALDQLLSHYSPDQLAAIADYADRAANVIAQDAARLRSIADTSHETLATGEQSKVPAAVTLVVERGLSKATITVDPAATELVVGQFWRTTPVLKQDGAQVSLAYRSSVFGSILMGARLALHPAPLWAIEVAGGISYASIDVSALTLSHVLVDGGIKATTLRLGQPSGVVRVDVVGDIAELEVSIPANASATIAVKGSASRSAVEGKPLTTSAKMGKGELSRDRYEFRIAGKVLKVSFRSLPKQT
jgi:DNA-binding MarR family transcriptional regulator